MPAVHMLFCGSPIIAIFIGSRIGPADQETNEKHVHLLIFYLNTFVVMWMTALTFIDLTKYAKEVIIFKIFLIPLLGLGILHSQHWCYPFIVFFQYSFYFIILLLLIKFRSDTLRLLLKRCLVTYLVVLILCSCLHRALGGDYLFTVNQISLPILLIGTLIWSWTSVYMNEKQPEGVFFWLIWLMYFMVFALGWIAATDLGQHRLQLTPFLIAMLFVFPILFLRAGLLRAIPIIIGLIGLSSLFIWLLQLDLSTLNPISRIGSLEERWLIIEAMGRKSFFFLFPQGLGSNYQNFSIGQDVKIAISARDAYPPHSGLFAMLYDLGFLGFMFLISLFILSVKRSTADSNLTVKNNRGTLMGGFNGPQLFGKIFFVLLAIFIVWNLAYIKVLPTGNTYSDDGLIIFLVATVLCFKLMTRH